MDKLAQILSRVISTDKIITQDEIESILKGVLDLLNNHHVNTQSLNDDTKATLQDYYNQIQDIVAEHNRNVEDRLAGHSEMSSATLTSKIEEIQALKKEIEDMVEDLMESKPLDGVDGYSPVKGVDYFTEDERKEIIEELKNDDVLPEAVRDALEQLQGDERLDAKYIKNIPFQFVGDPSLGSPAGGGGTPGGSSAQVQFNDAGSFAGNAAFTFNKTTGGLSVTSITLSSLTSGRIPYVGTGGLLTDSTDMLWSSSSKTLYIQGTNTSSSGTATFLSLLQTVAHSGTAGYKALQINLTETSLGSGVQYLASFEVGGAVKAYLTNKGVFGFTHGIEIGYNPGGASAAQNAIRNVGGISFTASTGGYGADNFHSDGTNMYYDLGNGMMFFRPQGGATYALYLNNNSTGLEYKGSAGTTVFSVSATGVIATAQSGTQMTFQGGSVTFSSTNGSSYFQPGFSGKTFGFRDSSGVEKMSIEHDTGIITTSNILLTANAITATANAATIPVTSGRNVVTNNSAATLTITLTTSGAVNMQTCVVQIKDFSAVAQTITWVNTENSTVSVPGTSNGSTTLPLTVQFIYNSATSKWRCVSSA